MNITQRMIVASMSTKDLEAAYKERKSQEPSVIDNALNAIEGGVNATRECVASGLSSLANWLKPSK